MENLSPYSLDLKEVFQGEKRVSYLLDEGFFQTIANEQYPDGRVEASVCIRKEGGMFELNFSYKGTLKLVCDRCLELFDFPVSTKRTLRVRLGDEYGEIEDDLIVVEREKGELNLMWRMFEDIALSVPIRHVHKEGECNPAMEKLLGEHSEASSADTYNAKKEEIDPRWESLKKLLNH